MAITQDEANDFLTADVQTAVDAVNDQVDVTLNQNQFDALVDFVFNVGSENFTNSTLLKLLNESDYEGASEQFDRWDYANGQVSPGLLARREEETEVFDEVDDAEDALT
jgi:lysozyme